MIGKNNQQARLLKAQSGAERFGLRKLSIGVASVLLGMTVYGVGTAHADEGAANVNPGLTSATSSTERLTHDAVALQANSVAANQPVVTTSGSSAATAANTDQPAATSDSGTSTGTTTTSSTVATHFVPGETFVNDQGQTMYPHSVLNVTYNPSVYFYGVLPDGTKKTILDFHKTVTYYAYDTNEYLQGITMSYYDENGRYLGTATAGGVSVGEVTTPRVDLDDPAFKDMFTMEQSLKYDSDKKVWYLPARTLKVNQGLQYSVTLYQWHQESKTVKRVVHYQYADGSQAAPDVIQPVTFTGRYYTYWGFNRGTLASQVEWTSKQGTYAAVTSPVLKGYTADLLTVPTAVALLSQTGDLETVVTYTKNPTPSTDPTDPTHNGQTNGQTNANGQSNPGQTNGQANVNGQPNPGRTNGQANVSGRSAQLVGLPSTSSQDAKASQQRLPQTGNHNQTALLGLGMATTLGMFGLAGRRRHKD